MGIAALTRKGLPYGEARRIRYFVKICEQVLQSPSVNMDFLISKALESVESLNFELENYVRKTGIMRSRAVARNYLRFADWLNFILIEGRLVIPNSYTVFLANLGQGKGFFLTKKEKIAFFQHLINVDDFFQLLASLRMRNAIKDHIQDDLSEHFVESFFEWLVDLNILRPTSTSFGRFNLNPRLGYPIHEFCERAEDPFIVTKLYATKLLDAPITSDSSFSEGEVWVPFRESLDKLTQYTRSEVDSRLFSAFPIILDLQLRLVIDYHALVSTGRLIQILKDILPRYDIIFSWNELSKAGYIKIGR